MKVKNIPVVKNKLFSVVPTITTTPYTAGDSIGGLQSFSNAIPIKDDGRGYIKNVQISDLQSADTEIDVIFFKDNPSNSTFAENTAVDVDDADLEKIIGQVTVAAADYIDFADNSNAFKDCDIPIPDDSNPGESRTLYVLLIERGTPTRAVGDITLKVGVVWEGEGS